ncbi:MAG: anthranilate phosphoribosyltransferase [Armatimonadetes bacterium]|nr:anthranilate phosphoribosyltransferase [Armatimonadota bacterium]
MVTEAIKKVLSRENLTERESAAVMASIMEGEVSPAQFGALVVGLRMKGETSEEITGFARAMREKSIKVRTNRPIVVDTCGTGGDRLNTFNISTTAAFIVAGAGAAVAKHGNRAASSKCGSADVLEALGVNISLSAEQVGSLIDEVGIGFLFAASLHPAMKHAAIPRREIGVRTVFNILGPLTNPAGARRQVLGVFEDWGCELLAGALARLGSERAMVVHGLRGIDELATFGETHVCEVRDAEVSQWVFRPQDVGLRACSPEDIAGGEAAHNAEVFMQVLSGGAPRAREIAALNAGAALFVSGLAESLQHGLELADATIAEGAALDVFRRYKDRSQALGAQQT